jgi:hypothetical protein
MREDANKMLFMASFRSGMCTGASHFVTYILRGKQTAREINYHFSNVGSVNYNLNITSSDIPIGYTLFSCSFKAHVYKHAVAELMALQVSHCIARTFVLVVKYSPHTNMVKHCCP